MELYRDSSFTVAMSDQHHWTNPSVIKGFVVIVKLCFLEECWPYWLKNVWRGEGNFQ